MSAGTYAKIVVDAKGRVTAGQSMSASDITSALTYTPVNRAGDTMAGNLAMGANDITNTGNITMAANKYLGLSANSTNGTVAGQMWYDTGTIKYYDGSVVKSLGVAGAGITTLNGLSTGTQSFVTGTAGTDFGISSAGSAHTFNIPTASASNRGALSSADWTTFNSKMSNSLASTQVWVGNASGAAAAVSLSGDISSITNAGVITVDKTTTAQANKILALDGSSVAITKGNQLNGATSGSLTLMPAAVTTNCSLTFPGAQGASGQVLSNNGSGVLSWANSLTNSLASAKLWVGNSGGTATAVSMSGDATMDNAGAVTLASSGVTAGSYAKVVVDAKGRVTAGQSMSASDITTALGFTPATNTAFINAGNSFGAAATLGTNDAYALNLETNNSTKMTIDSTGKVGVGTTSPETSVHVKSSNPDTDNGILKLSSNNAVDYAGITLWSGATSPNANSRNWQIAANYMGSGNLDFIGSTTNTGNPNSLAAMSISRTGNVGIGTTSPATKLDVAGTASVNSSIESASTYVNSTATYTIPDSTVNIRRITLTANATITLPAFATPTGKVWTLTVMVKQDGAGSRTLAWTPPGGDSILWDQSASAPAPASAASKITIYQFTKMSDETTWYASMVWKQN